MLFSKLFRKSEAQAFSCQRGKLTVRGCVYGETDEPQEAVILCHGFLANQSTVTAYAKVIAGLGFRAFTFDFCGGGLGVKSDGKSEDMTVLTEVRDLRAVIQYVSSLPGITAVSLLGCSQGGFVSAMTAKQLGAEKIRRLMLFYPALCIPDDARKGQMISYRFDPEKIPDLLGRVPMRLGGDYARAVIHMDPFDEIQGYAGPTLLLHGTADDLVNISYSRRAKDCFPQCEYHEIMGGGHGFTGKYDAEACEYLKRFLKEI